MTSTRSMHRNQPQAPLLPRFPAVPFSSNALRLSPRAWLAVLAALLLITLALPPLWHKAHPLDPAPDYRIPYSLSEDYHLYQRYSSLRAAQDKVLLVGDSVVWGEYVAPDHTLSHYLNELTASDRFANLGVNGLHPAALAGLLDHFAPDLRDRRIILHYNPLWMSSPRHDLTSDEPFNFNHPRLVPQLTLAIPAYDADLSERLGIAITRQWDFHNFLRHLKLSRYHTTDLPAWLYDHPYANPLAPLAQPLPQPTTDPRHDQQTWRQRGLTPHNFDWVPLEKSLQWRQFQKAIQTLRNRDNELFVLVGPFNEPMLTPQSQDTYNTIKHNISQYLTQNHIPHLIAPPLPPNLYADASHPLPQGYQQLATELLAVYK